MTDPHDIERAGKAALSVLRKVRRADVPVERVQFSSTERSLIKRSLEAMDLQFLRAAYVDVVNDLKRAGLSETAVGDWPQSTREQVFHIVETALTVAGFNRWKAASLLHMPGGLLDRWMRTTEWQTFIADEQRVYPMVATLKRVALGVAMEAMTSPSVSTSDDRAKVKLAADVLGIMAAEQRTAAAENLARARHALEAEREAARHEHAMAELTLRKEIAATAPLPPPPEDPYPAHQEPGFTTRPAPMEPVFDGEDEPT